MEATIPIAQTVAIRDCGLDEYWLQDQIIANPTALGLGELEVLSRERQQSIGGRLDLLLKDPEDDSMYEVEVMLGETDETHIIRTIEYWDNEKRKWPQRQHFAVLVAESITRRFFNVIQLFSHSIPIIAIQANIIDASGTKSLHFSKILDTYEEPEDSISMPSEVYNEEYWRTKASWTIDAARGLLDLLNNVYANCSLYFVKSYIAITVDGNNCFWFHKRSSDKSLLSFWLTESQLSQAASVLDNNGISYVKKTQSIRFTVNKQMIQSNAEMFKQIARLVRDSWQS